MLTKRTNFTEILMQKGNVKNYVLESYIKKLNSKGLMLYFSLCRQEGLTLG